MAHRYFTTDIADGQARLSGPDAQHLARVLRVKPGERLTLCDGAGYDYEAEVTEVSPGELLCRVLEKSESRSEPRLHAELFVAYGKGDKMDWVVQKAVELGAAAIAPFLCTRCVARPKQDKSERLACIAHEAAKQSGRGILPEVLPLLNFDEMLGRALQNETALLLHPGGEARLSSLAPGTPSLALITGPEGGFTPEEAEQARAAGCLVAGLGPRILRCETAPLAALAAAMALLGEL